MTKAGSEFEKLIHEIYLQIVPNSNVKLNDQILGIESGINREIDISIRSRIGIHDLLTIIQAKDHKYKVDINLVGAFEAVLKDVRASKGILISRVGFTNGAIKYAKNKGIDLCTAHEAKSKNWQREFTIPLIIRAISVFGQLAFEFMGNEEIAGKQLTVNMADLYQNNIILLDGSRTSFGNEFLKRWNLKIIPRDVIGDYNFDLFMPGIKFDLNGFEIPLSKLNVTYSIDFKYFFKFVEPDYYQGIFDYLSNKFTPTKLSLKIPMPIKIDSSWQAIKNPNNISVESVHLDIEDFNFLFSRITQMRILPPLD